MVQFLVSYIVLVLWLNKTLAMESLSLSMPSCPDKCGEVSIPYPFGIGPGCYFDESFAVTCRLNDSKPYLTSINMEILNISMQGFIQVNNPVISSNCSKLAVGAAMSQYSGSGYVDLGHRPFSFSSYYSRFTIVGCEIYGTIISNENNKTLGGCFSSCDNSTVVSLSEDQNGCYGLNCCQAALPTSSNLKSFKANIISTPSLKSDQVCRAAFMVDQQWFEQQQNSSIDSILNETSVVPAVLEWGKTDGSCALDNYSPNITFCSSDGFCWAMIDSSYLCVCNPKSSFNSFLSSTSSISYISGGCGGTSSILSCPSQTSFGCQLVCLEDSPNCSCPSDYEKHDTGCYPLKLIIDPVGLGNRGPFFLLVLGVLLPIAIWLLYKLMRKRKAVKQRQKFFKRNGGLLLQQQLLTSDNGMEKTKLFTSRDLEKATDKYNVDRILGQGGQGIVYKGMLRDGKLVAVKKSKVVDEAQLGQFINEVMILSQIDHRNVLKLLGFCLETEVPMLVYEFMPNGTLYEYIHDQNEELPFTWDMRLRIATEVANALSYLHSAASAPIYHRDIKSTNILLDDRYRAKVSDFGTSRSIAIDKTHLTTKVKGTFGYLDPEYFQSSLFTEKSDVYSFGVVLVELLTGQKPISSIGHEEYRNLAMLFHQSMDENRLIEILDPQVIKDGGKLNEITIVSNLAKRCLNIHGRYRPTMKEVVQELEGIRMPGRAAEPNHEADGSTFDYINRIWDTTPSSTVTFSSNDFEQPLEEEKRLITGTQ